MANPDLTFKEYYKTEFYQHMPRGTFDYCTNISVQSSYIYFETAKVACTSIKKTLKYIESEILNVAPPINTEGIHQKNILLSPSSIGVNKFYEMLNDKNVIKFSFVRNPYTRILSAFLDKINRKNNLQNKTRVLFTNQFNLDCDSEITFNQFLNIIKDQPYRLMDHHWRPQTNQLFWGTVDFDFIGRFENFEQDFKQILEKIYSNYDEKDKLLDIKELLGHKTSAQSYLQDFYDDEAKELVKEIYKEDFQNFNYPVNLPLSPNSDKVIKSVPQTDFKNESFYLKVWNALNQKSLKDVDEESFFYSPKKIDRGMLEQYFTQISQYKTINLESLTKEDKQLIEDAGLSLTYLELNRSRLVTKEGCSQGELSIYPEFQQSEQIDSLLRKVNLRTDFQQSLIEEGCINAICPSTGRILSSNCSLMFWGSFFYRFVGNEIFYLITQRPWIEKCCLYFPKRELIVHLVSLKEPHSNGQRNIEKRINGLKSDLVINREKIKSYLINNQKAETVAIIGLFENLGHHLWNELSAIQKLYDDGTLHMIDKFFVVGSEFCGRIDEIFPEIPSEKIKRINRREVYKEILENNYFAFRLGYLYIREDLAKRLYQLSLKKCSSAYLAKVEEAKKHFPLVWVDIRLTKKWWVSQIEGLANIINKLYLEFPNLAVVFDGFSLPDTNINIDAKSLNRRKVLIKKEQTVVE